jgi:aryl-alcohol dehydrogenase-like predicted oxidoreductase
VSVPAPRLSDLLGPLSRLSLGAATFGREIDQDASFQLMDHALARGITHFDTAANYSQGASERIVGAWLASRRPAKHAPSVATKVYPPFTPDALDSAVAASAARLGVATIDLLYLHRWDETALAPASLRALDGLVRDGRVRALGVSNFNAAQLQDFLTRQQALGLSPVHALQNNHNLAVRDIDEPLARLCADHRIAIITYSPLGAGFLTGKHLAGVQPGSRFAVIPGHQQVYFNPVAERRLAHLANVAARAGQAMSHLALAWAVHEPRVTSTLIGGRALRHLDQAFDALAFSDPALLAELGAN